VPDDVLPPTLTRVVEEPSGPGAGHGDARTQH
jgi:hypothetical protein